MGRATDPLIKKRTCCELFSCKSGVWKEYMQQYRNGIRWLWSLMVIQIVYILAYLTVAFLNSRQNIIVYQYFNLVIIVWLVIFNLFFLRNAIYRFLIEELKISFVTMFVMSIYMLVIYLNNLLVYLKLENKF